MSPPSSVHAVSLFLLVLLSAALQATAHMSMATPPSLRYKTNPYKTVEDYDYSSPLSPSGSNYPCKGYHKDFGTPGGRSVATYSPGGSYSIVYVHPQGGGRLRSEANCRSLRRLAGSATHMGGSCQISLSFDQGNTWVVIKSIIGGCANPNPGGSQEFGFTIPGNAQGGDVLLAWYVYMHHTPPPHTDLY